MLGAIADQLPFSADVLLACVVKRFARKGEQVVEMNRKAFAAGRAAAAQASVPA
jgi:indolepyruvate ferredoxin oxidoreductase beta subunit